MLEGIDGIGDKTAEQVLKKFKSVKRIKEASLKDLSEVVGWSKAKKIYENFH
ncbi:helix-hairpin-helix domain-containing protein [Muriicola sp.]|uniref:helix-hairpin-helix domain-containing protein n=1 Tax=Muriicola sp. TaxID=2020856 RepID=UPI003C70C19C